MILAVSIRSRFILISVSLTLLALLLFSSVMYDRAIQYKHQQEISTSQILVDQLFQLISGLNDLNKIKDVLAENIILENQPAKLFIIADKNNITKYIFKQKGLETQLYEKSLSQIKNSKSEGKIINGNNEFYWYLKDLSVNDKNKLFIVYSLSPSILSEFLKFFGLPFFISGFLLCWMMVWASIILSSLVVKLQKQKQTLSNQSAYVEKARDEALHANSAKSDFLANMSHEIRTPLTSIIGFAETGLDIDQSMKERLNATKTIIKSGKHLMHIINEILDISKIEAGKFEIEAAPTYLMKIIDEVNQLVSILATEKSLTFAINCSYPLPEKIITDPLRLKQILINLCSNAIKFTNTGYVYLNVAYKPDSSSLMFDVIDTGIGLSAKQQEKIFMPFEQADSSATREFGGTGLGLTLSKQLAEMLNGTLTVESTVNNGSCFTVKLDIVEDENSNYIYEGQQNNKFVSLHQDKADTLKLNGRVLLVEDNEDIQNLVKIFITKLGIELDIVGNGMLAIKKVMEIDYDLVFMDIQMPVMDGFTAMKKLKHQGYSKPVIVMTANAMQKDREKYNEIGFSSFVSKPFNRNEIYSALIQYLKPNKTFEDEKIVLTSNLLIDEPDLIDLIEKFMNRLPEMQAAINQAHEEGKGEKLSGLVHQIKGVGGGYGYPSLTELSAKIEFQIANQNSENVNTLIKELNVMIEEILAGRDENHKIAEQAQS